MATEAGADYLGFIFYPKSPRYVEAHILQDILDALPENCPSCMGVFVNPTQEEVETALNIWGLDFVQLHGEETRDFCHLFSQERCFKVLRPESLDEIEMWRDHPQLMIDGLAGDAYGGQGIKTDWALARAVKKAYNGRFFLAGGLTPDNVAEAIAKIKPDVVDVASGVEKAPGVKDIEKVKSFVKAVRE